MTFRPLTLAGPAGLLCLLAAGAHAELAPYGLTASETVSHQSNLYRSSAATQTSDWISSTQLQGQFDQTFGRDRVLLQAGVDLGRYRYHPDLNHSGYHGSAELDWAVAGNLSGAVGADSVARLYRYGSEGEQASSTRNIETTNHVFAKSQLGGTGLWTLLADFDGVQRNYSDLSFAPNEQRQWSIDGGARYAASPDLTATTTLTYTRGRYPYFDSPLGADDFSLHAIDERVRWQASGVSTVDLDLGYTREKHDILASRNYWSGLLRWTWAPPSHLKLVFDLQRNAGTQGASLVDAVNNPANLTSRSINTALGANLNWELTGKISATATLQSAQREYADLVVLGQSRSGSNHTRLVDLGLQYQATQALRLSCGFAREVRSTDAAIAPLTPAYSANTLNCRGQLSLR